MYLCAEHLETECLQWIVYEPVQVNNIASLAEIGLSVEVISMAFGFGAGVTLLFYTLGRLHGWIKYGLREALT